MSPSEDKPDIDQIRSDIDQVDTEILRLLAERKSHALRMARLKGIADRPSRDQSREEDLIADRVSAASQHNLDSELIIKLWRTIVNDSVRIQQEALGRETGGNGHISVAIQGIEGSYSHLAAEHFFHAKGMEAVYVRTNAFSDAVETVRSGKAKVAVLPIENTTSGAISEVYDLLLDADLHFVGDIKLRIRHCLLGLHGTSPADIRKVYCHPQAAAQCSEFLAGLEDCEIVHFSDTALSGKRIKELDDPTVAAIASEEAARLYGLEVIKTGIANREENYTRFVVVAADPVEVPEGVPAKTSAVMATGNRPGALMDALGIFREGDINLVKLESRPIPHNPREELFYVDFEGNVADPSVQETLDALKKQVRFLKVLGSYPSRDLRPRPSKDTRQAVEPEGREALVLPVHSKDSPKGYKLGSRGHKEANTVIEVGDARFGGEELVLIGGPCAVESWDQVVAAARQVKASGGTVLRGGCFKPRTSPYSFQGLGFEGLEMLAEAGKTFGLPIVTEVLSPEDVEEIAKKADILQIGTRNMQNFSLLSAVGVGRR